MNLVLTLLLLLVSMGSVAADFAARVSVAEGQVWAQKMMNRNDH